MIELNFDDEPGDRSPSLLHPTYNKNSPVSQQQVYHGYRDWRGTMEVKLFFASIFQITSLVGHIY